MNKLTSALAAILVLGSASVALASAPAADLAGNGPLVNQPDAFVTKSVALPQNVHLAANWMDRASKSYDGGGY